MTLDLVVHYEILAPSRLADLFWLVEILIIILFGLFILEERDHEVEVRVLTL